MYLLSERTERPPRGTSFCKRSNYGFTKTFQNTKGNVTFSALLPYSLFPGQNNSASEVNQGTSLQ